MIQKAASNLTALAITAALLLPSLPATADSQSLLGSGIGNFKLTYYWIVYEQEFPGRPAVPLYTTDGKVIAVVTDRFAERVTMEGTGVLRDGRIVNLHEECDFATHGWCFLDVDRDAAPFGYGSYDPLRPFRTLAVPSDEIPRGTVVYVPDFDGMPLPTDEGGFDFHDGCFVVEDTGWSLHGKHIDLFALAEAHYKALDERMKGRERVSVFLDSPLCPSSSSALYDPATWVEELASY